MALATQADVEAALGRDLSASEAARVESLLRRASALVIGYTGQDFEPAPYPETVADVVAGMVRRLFQVGDEVVPEREQAGPFMRAFGSNVTSGDIWLSAADKLMLKPYRRSGGLTSVQLVGELYTITPDES